MRIVNWDLWLVRYAEVARGQEFEWGRTDCVTLTRRGLTMILGTDPWRGLIKKWVNKTGALRAARSVSPEDALRVSGAVEVGKQTGTSGDVALGAERDTHGLPAIALLLPTRKALVSTPSTGVVIVDKLNLPDGTRFFRYE